MLFLVVSTPRPERPSEFAAQRQKFWPWIENYQANGMCRIGLGRRRAWPKERQRRRQEGAENAPPRSGMRKGARVKSRPRGCCSWDVWLHLRRRAPV